MAFLLIVLAFSGLLTVLCVLGSRRVSVRWQGGVLLGVHVPPSAEEDPEVRALLEKTARRWRITAAVNLPLGLLVCLPVYWNVMAGVLLWMAWFFVFIGWSVRLERSAHRAMYQIKCRRGWFDEATRHKVQVDTRTAAQSGRGVPGWYWQLPLLVALALPLPYAGGLRPALRASFWLLFGGAVFTGLLLTLLHRLAAGRPNRLYTTDAARNLAANRREKRAWAWGFLAAGAANTAAWCRLGFRLLRGPWAGTADYVLYAVTCALGVGVLLALQLHARLSNRRELGRPDPPALADDDEYWQNGWYDNPNDPRAFVQRSATRFEPNRGSPRGRAFMTVMNLLIAATLAVTVAVMAPFVNVQVAFAPDGAGGGAFSAALYRTAFTAEEVRGVELTDSWPEENFVRTNGGASDSWLVGHFYGSQTGDCRLYLYPGATPILKVKLEDVTVYANSRDPDQTRQWAALLLVETGVY